MELYPLLYHLKRCPEEFLQKPGPALGKKLQTEVLVKDRYRKILGDFCVADDKLPSLKDIGSLSENHQLSIQVGCWLVSHPSFDFKPNLMIQVHKFLFMDLKEVCMFVKHREWVEDDDRAEEFIRLLLKRCEILPEGETEAQALDRLDALDTIKRQEVFKESNASMERIREIRRKMAEQKAREAANVYGRE
ncbi:MAG: hypothetical protein JXB49_25835 [Bacteroidales bacterium]|nr:hypothetical protein [Bacteroidales bacterium]